MRLARALQRLPCSFDPAPLAAAIAGLTPDCFIPYRAGALGGSAIPLVSPGGVPSDDFALAGPARPTPILARCPALQDMLAALGVPIARSRLIRLGAQTSAGSSTEWNYHWFRHFPICIPVQTDSTVTLKCGDQVAHMAAGEAWIFDNSRGHELHNRSAQDCIHLIVETATPVSPVPPAAEALRLEPYRFGVLTPQEFAALTAEILGAPSGRPTKSEEMLTLAATLAQLGSRWESAFARFGHDSRGELAYLDIVLDFRQQVMPQLTPGSAPAQAAAIIDTMLNMAPPQPRKLRRPVRAAMTQAAALPVDPPDFARPLFIVSAPRAGSTLLFDLVSRFRDVLNLGGESHEIIRGIPELHPAARSYASDRLTSAEARPEIAAALRREFTRRLVDRSGQYYLDLPASERPNQVRLLEKTPANALRIPFLRAVFPDALFVHLYREPKENISSLVEGWRSRRFLAYSGMPGWPYRDWSFLLPPGWESLAGCSLIEIAAQQWKIANTTIEEDLRLAPSGSYFRVEYSDLVRTPASVLRSIAAFAELEWDQAVETAAASLPISSVTLSAPAPDKWRRHEAELAALLPRLL